MSSSKFSSRPLVLKRPIVCKYAPPPQEGWRRPYPPTQIHAFVNHIDLDPLGHSRQQSLLLLTWFPTAFLYFGRSAPAGDRLELTFAPTATPGFWNATLKVFGWWPGPEPFYYTDVLVPLDQPFRTPKGPMMHPPAHPSCRCGIVLKARGGRSATEE